MPKTTHEYNQIISSLKSQVNRFKTVNSEIVKETEQLRKLRDTVSMYLDAKNYEIETEEKFLDVIKYLVRVTERPGKKMFD